MANPARIPATPKGSSLERLVADVAIIYARIEADQASFLAGAAALGSALVCPQGCGACCEPFVPDLLPPEAAFMAAWLLENEPELAREAAAWTQVGRAAPPPCPFLRRDLAGDHAGAGCAVYPARPLVCRLFGAAGVSDREGRASFRPCAHMPLAGYPPMGEERPTLSGPALLRGFGSEPPLMASYAAELVALSPSQASERSLIVQALPQALSRVALSLALAEGSALSTY